jgi:hypothetical protein
MVPLRSGVLASSALLCSALVACGSKTGSPFLADPDGSAQGTGTDGAALSPSATDPGDTVGFVPFAVWVVGARWFDGSETPPRYMSGDTFQMAIEGNMSQWPAEELNIVFDTPIAVGEPFTLAVQALMVSDASATPPVQSARGSGIDFGFSHATGASEIDDGAFDSVTVTLLAIPAADGDLMTLRLRIHFADGRVLDETFSARIRSGCCSSSGG